MYWRYPMASERTESTIIDLKVLARLKPGDRITKRGNNFDILEAGWMQMFARWTARENRTTNLEAIRNVIDEAIRLMGGYESMLQQQLNGGGGQSSFPLCSPQDCVAFIGNMVAELRAASGGLANLQKTYETDHVINAQYEVVIERIRDETARAEAVVTRAPPLPPPAPILDIPPPPPLRESDE